jgi:hypothetical protein
MLKTLSKSASLLLLAAELSDYDPETGSQVKPFIEHYIGMDKDDWQREEFNNKIKQTGDMWGAIPHLYHPDEERKRAGLKERYAAAYNRLKELTKYNDLTLYRGLATTEEVIDRIIKGERFDLGKHWTLVKGKAFDFASPNAFDFASPNAAGPVGLIFTGTADVSGINILKTLKQMIQFPEEQEVQLEYGTPITVEKIEMRHGGLYHHDDMVRIKEKVDKINPAGMKFIASVEIKAEDPSEYDPKNGNIYRIFEVLSKFIHPILMSAKSEDRKILTDHIVKCKEQDYHTGSSDLSEYDPEGGDPEKIAIVMAKHLGDVGGSLKDVYLEAFIKSKKKDPFPKGMKLDAYYRDYKDVYESLNDQVYNGVVEIYRMMTISIEQLFEIKNTETNLGVYWSYAEHAADVYNPDSAEGCVKVKLHGAVDETDIDWGVSIIHNMSREFSQEKEIRVPSGTSIDLKQIEIVDVVDSETAKDELANMDVGIHQALDLGPDDLKNYDKIYNIINDNSSLGRDTMSKVNDIYADTFIKNFDIRDIFYRDRLALYFMVHNFNPIAQILMRYIPGDRWTEIAYDPDKVLPYFLEAEKDIKDYLRRENPRDIVEEFRDKYHFNLLFQGATGALQEAELIDDIEKNSGEVTEEYLQELVDSGIHHEHVASKNNR